MTKRDIIKDPLRYIDIFPDNIEYDAYQKLLYAFLMACLQRIEVPSYKLPRRHLSVYDKFRMYFTIYPVYLSHSEIFSGKWAIPLVKQATYPLPWELLRLLSKKAQYIHAMKFPRTTLDLCIASAGDRVLAAAVLCLQGADLDKPGLETNVAYAVNWFKDHNNL